MKVCILSMQRVDNYGSLLQSFSLMKILESLGNEVEFIDIERNEHDNTLMKDAFREFGNEGDKYDKNAIRRWLKKVDCYFFRRVKQRIQYEMLHKDFAKFREEYLHLKDKANNNEKQYDFCVIGSDEVFNCTNNTSWGFTTQLFGNVRQAKTVITYAASCGYTSVDMVPAEAKQAIKKAFEKIQTFSVRDENTFAFVRELAPQKKINYNLDPALIGEFDDYIKKHGQKLKLPKKYCLVYAYGNRINRQEEIKSIISFCNLHGLELIAMGEPQKWIKKYIVASPFQLLYAFQNSSFVITDTFHGTVFSYKYAKRFAIVCRGSNQNKLGDLIERLGIKDHQLIQLSDLEKIYSIESDRQKVKEVLSCAKRDTKEYLTNAIKE